MFIRDIPSFFNSSLFDSVFGQLPIVVVIVRLLRSLRLPWYLKMRVVSPCCLASAKAILSKSLIPPVGIQCEQFEGYWLRKGDEKPIRDERYILTEAVKANMKDIARVIACGWVCSIYWTIAAVEEHCKFMNLCAKIVVSWDVRQYLAQHFLWSVLWSRIW